MKLNAECNTTKNVQLDNNRKKNKGKGLGLIFLKFIVHVLGEAFVFTTNDHGGSIKCYWNHLVSPNLWTLSESFMILIVFNSHVRF